MDGAGGCGGGKINIVLKLEIELLEVVFRNVVQIGRVDLDGLNVREFGKSDAGEVVDRRLQRRRINPRVFGTEEGLCYRSLNDLSCLLVVALTVVSPLGR